MGSFDSLPSGMIAGAHLSLLLPEPPLHFRPPPHGVIDRAELAKGGGV